MYFREVVGKLLEAFPEVEAVGVESPTFGESQSSTLYGLFLYVNEALMLHHKDVVYLDPLRVKLLAKMDSSVRKGTMDKSDMVDIAKQDTGIKRWNNDEADAYIIARSAARFWDRYYDRITDEDLTPSEDQVFRSVHTFVKGKKAGKTVGTGVLFKEDDRFYRFSQLRAEDLTIDIPNIER